MNEIKRKMTLDYFAGEIAACKAIAQKLSGDQREDEAVFAKIQGNVFDIFQSVFSAAVKIAGQDDEKVVQFFMTKLKKIPQNWRSAREKALQYGQDGKAHIEQVKLDAALRIEQEFLRIWEDRRG